jgi:hypothetical protein
MKYTRFRILLLALIAVLACCLSGCELLGFKYEGFSQQEEGEQQIEIDRPYAESCMRAYLSEKYGLSDDEYSISDLAPWTLDSITYISTPGGAYYSGLWQAKITIGDESFYASVAVSGDQLSHDSWQADEYYSKLEVWIRANLQLPDSCEVDIDI